MVHVAGFLEFGALVVLPSGFEGLLHDDEITWEREKKHAGDMLRIGQSLRVKVKAVDPEKERIAVSLKDATADP